ncbi:MAG: hypothetical protein QW303_05655 [Nitrososphaerota archaeon]
MSVDLANLDTEEIRRILNSGKYITVSVRKSMLERLKGSYKPSSSEQSSSINPSGSLKDGKSYDEEFPLLGKSSVNVDERTKLKYTDLLSRKSQPSSLLFRGNKMILAWNEIIRMYDYYAIYRIRMKYLLLGRKIRILDSIYNINREKGERFRQFFRYNKLRSKYLAMERCIMIYLIMKNVQLSLDLLGELVLNYSSIKNDEASFGPKIRKVKEHLSFIGEKLNFIRDDSLGQIEKMVEFIGKLYHVIIKEEDLPDDKEILANRIGTMKSCVEEMLKKIVDNNDIYLRCSYNVCLRSSDVNKIVPVGLTTTIYLDCQEEISLEIPEQNLDTTVLEKMELEDLESFFDRKMMDKYLHFIYLWMNHPKMGSIYINYYVSEQIPSGGVEIQITDLPLGSKVFTSMLGGSEDILHIPMFVKPNPVGRLYKRTNNPLYIITPEDYKYLDPMLKEKYQYEDTSRYIFLVDYIFSELLSYDESFMIIKPNMLDSFRILASFTSKI